MRVTVAVILPSGGSFPVTARLYVEIRDVSLLDAPSITLCARESSLKTAQNGGVLATLDFNVPEGEKRRTLNVWGHLSLSGNKKIAQGDFLTTQAYPVNQEVTHDHIAIELQRI